MEILLGNTGGEGPYPYPDDQYLGEVLPANLISGNELATLLGFSSGLAKDDQAGWLKFKSQEGITFLVAKKTIRYRLSWNLLEAALLVYGTRQVNIQGNAYKVRLIRGAETDPSAWLTSDSQENPPIAKPSEWNRFMHRVAVGNPTGAPAFANFSLSDLSIAVSSTGRMTLCQETLGQTTTQSIARGNANLSQFNYVNKSDGTIAGQDHYGWRPVLELVGVAKEYPNSGPGQKWLQAGDEQLGYFGEVAASDMITNANLKTHLGLANGSTRADQGYLKFFYKGKVVFVGKNTFATSLTWNQLYAAGGVYGTKDNGKYPASTPVNQYKPLTWGNGGKSFKLIPRAMTCAPEPFENSQDPLVGNEYSDLLGRLFVNTMPGSGQWGRYTAAQLNMNVVHMGPETRGSNTNYASVRGYSGGSVYTSLLSLTKADASGYSQHFRMVLEVEGDPMAEPPVDGPAFWLEPSDQIIGSATVTDKSYRNVAVTNNGAVVSADGPAPGIKSLYFDKSSFKYLRMPGSAMPNALGKDFQIDFWFKPDGQPAGFMPIVAQWAQSASNDGLIVNFLADGKEYFHFGPFNNNGPIMQPANANANLLNWSKYSIRRKGSSFEMWQDGVLVATAVTAITASKTVDWMIGAYMNSSNTVPASGTVALGGWLADFRVYDFYRGAYAETYPTLEGPLNYTSLFATAPNALSNMQAGINNDSLHVFGGYKASSAMSQVYSRLALATKTWANSGNIASLAFGSGVFCNGSFYAGAGSNGSYTNAFWKINPDTYAATNLANMPSPLVAQSRFVSLDGTTINVVGGYDIATSKTSAKHYKYDTVANTWTPLADLPISVNGHYAGAYGGKLYVGGGYNETAGTTADIREYDPATNTWTVIGTAPVISSWVGGCVYRNYFVMAIIEDAQVSLQLFNLVTKTWSKFKTGISQRRQFEMVADKNGVYIIGGVNSANVGNGTWTTAARYTDVFLVSDAYTTDAYLGEVAGADFITASALQTTLGITEGADIGSGVGWLKFNIDGKTLMVAKRSFRHNISWNHINSKGCVDGTKTVVIGGKTYKVRLMKGAEDDPTGWTTSLGQSNPPILKSSEWNRLMFRVSASNPGGASNWASFTDVELGVGSGAGSRTICKETIAENGYCVGRGYPEIKWFNYQQKSDGPDNSNFANFGWRPVLELVE